MSGKHKNYFNSYTNDCYKWMELHSLQAVVVFARGLIWGLFLTINPDLPPPVRGKWISQPSPELPDGELGAGSLAILGHVLDPILYSNAECSNDD